MLHQAIFPIEHIDTSVPLKFMQQTSSYEHQQSNTKPKHDQLAACTANQMNYKCPSIPSNTIFRKNGQWAHFFDLSVRLYGQRDHEYSQSCI